MRHRVCWLGLLLLVGLLGTGFGPPVLTERKSQPLRLYPEHLTAMRRMGDSPAVTAASALVADLASGRVLYAKAADVPRLPASTVKLMTALLAVRNAGLGEVATVSPAAAEMAGSRMGLVAGEEITVRDLLLGLLLPSGNDAAVALAEHIAGSEERFVGMMNRMALELGMTHTHFANASGLDDPDQWMSAADLLLLTRAVMAVPELRAMVAKQSARAGGRSLVNTNQLLGNYPGADGVKTGTSEGSGECLVASVTRNGHATVVIVLGSRDRYADATVLLDFAAARWEWRSLDLPDNALAWDLGSDGRSYRLRAIESGAVLLPVWQAMSLQAVRVITPTALFTDTTPVGSLRWMLGDRLLSSTPLTVWQGP